ncbi:hypothetical protein HDU88_003417 [Geranomyces variabilis]|nr:hypothetical protein HDU88_003417 [Geranomyces variabilis]
MDAGLLRQLIRDLVRDLSWDTTAHKDTEERLPEDAFSMYVEFLTGIRTAQENCYAIDSKLYEKAQQFSTACMWANYFAVGAVCGTHLPSGWMGVFCLPAYKSTGYDDGTHYELTTHQSSVVVPLAAGDMLLGFYSLEGMLFGRRIHDDRANRYICEISAQIPGHNPVVFYRHEKDAYADDKMYSAVKILAKTLGMEEETIRRWVFVCFHKYELRDAPAAQNLWPGPEILHIPKAILKPATKCTGLSPVILDSMSRLRQADRYRHTEGLWLPICRITQHARAASRLIALPLLYSALCIQFSEQLQMEPVASIIDVEAWATNTFTFKYEAGDGLVDMEDFEFEGRPLSVEFARRRNGSSAEFPTIDLSADDTPGNREYECELKFRSPREHKFHGPTFLRYDCHKLDIDFDQWWLNLSDRWWEPRFSFKDETTRTVTMDLWTRLDPDAEWGGPQRFTLMLVAMSLCFVINKASMVALGHVFAMDDHNNSSDDSDFEDSESASDHSSEFWSDQEIEGDEITDIADVLTFEEQTRKVVFPGREPPVESQHMELAQIAIYLMERKLLYPTIPDQLSKNSNWLYLFLGGSAHGEDWLAEYVRAHRRLQLPIARHFETWYDNYQDYDESAGDFVNEYLTEIKPKSALPGQWERVEDWMAEEIYRQKALSELESE